MAQPPADESVDTQAYVVQAVAAIREHGFIAAGRTDAEPTWRTALRRLCAGSEVTPADTRRAHEILGWVASLHPRDPEGYRARLADRLRHDRLAVRDLPLAASAVRTFNVHLYYELRGRKSHTRQASQRQPARRDAAPS